ncbi:biotrophy-associated secreted protein 2 [Paraphaeosphaeria sporulosa]
MTNEPSVSLYVTAQGKQFITGPCTSDADCATQCCGFRSGLCAAVIPAQERDGGCGFGNPAPNAGPNANTGAAAAGTRTITTSIITGSSPAATSAAGTGSGKAPGTQFITGVCASDADCASACCGRNSGKCAAVIPAQERDGGCGFGDAQPNSGPGANSLRRSMRVGRHTT